MGTAEPPFAKGVLLLGKSQPKVIERRPPIYTRHARQRMARRQITEAEVEEVLRNHDTAYPGRGGTQVLVGGAGHRRIKVVVSEAADGTPVIVTVAGKGEPL